MDKPVRDSFNEPRLLLFFFFVPTLMLIVGYILFPNQHSTDIEQFLIIPLFAGLILLGIGFFVKNLRNASLLKLIGWILFAMFWATRPAFLYLSEAGDIFNAAVCVIGVYVLIYMAYHEWLSLLRNEKIPSLNWIAGGTFFAGIIYFSLDNMVFPQLKYGLIDVVAAQSAWLLQLVGFDVTLNGPFIGYNSADIRIIFACTAIQSIVLFVGMIGAIPNVSVKKKAIALCATVIPIYFLNLFRNAGVIFLVGNEIVTFNIAHNVIAKAGSLVALIVLLFITFKIIPTLYDEILGLFNLTKRNGPVEQLFSRMLSGKK